MWNGKKGKKVTGGGTYSQTYVEGEGWVLDTDLRSREQRAQERLKRANNSINDLNTRMEQTTQAADAEDAAAAKEKARLEASRSANPFFNVSASGGPNKSTASQVKQPVSGVAAQQPNVNPGISVRL